MNELALIGLLTVVAALWWVAGLIKAVSTTLADPVPSWAPDFADQEAALEQLTLEHEFVRDVENWLVQQEARRG